MRCFLQLSLLACSGAGAVFSLNAYVSLVWRRIAAPVHAPFSRWTLDDLVEVTRSTRNLFLAHDGLEGSVANRIHIGLVSLRSRDGTGRHCSRGLRSSWSVSAGIFGLDSVSGAWKRLWRSATSASRMEPPPTAMTAVRHTAAPKPGARRSGAVFPSA